MPVGGLLSAAALAGVGQTIWQYNRENYMFDVPLRQARDFQVQNVNLARYALFREDIRDLASLTTDKVSNLLVVNTLKVGFIVALYFNFDRTDTGYQDRSLNEDILSVLFGMTLLTSFFFLMTSIWFAMHALQLAQAITTKLLVQVVRIPLPSEFDIAAAASEGRDFEMNFREALRVPFIEENQAKPGSPNPPQPEKEASPVRSRTQRFSTKLNTLTSAVRDKVVPDVDSRNLDDQKAPLVERGAVTVSLQDLIYGIRPEVEHVSQMEPHLKLLSLVASSWQPFDLYSKVTTVLGSSCLFSGLAYYSIYYNKGDNHEATPEAWCCFLFMSTLAWWNLTIELAANTLDLTIAALLILVGPVLWLLSNRPTLTGTLMRHFGYPLLVTIQASWIIYLGVRACTFAGEWPHFFVSTRYLNVLHKQRGPIDIPQDIARKAK
ncbi:unnamed protein product, partial [Effrenium voratum]